MMIHDGLELLGGTGMSSPRAAVGKDRRQYSPTSLQLPTLPSNSTSVSDLRADRPSGKEQASSKVGEEGERKRKRGYLRSLVMPNSYTPGGEKRTL